MGNAPADSGKGQLNPGCIFITGEIFVEGGVNGIVVNLINIAYLLVPFDISGVGGNIEFDQSVLVEKYSCSAGVGAEIGGEGGVFAAKCGYCLFCNHFVSCSAHIFVSIKVYLGGGWMRRSRGGSDREGRKSGRVGDKVLCPGFGSPWVICALGIKEVSEGGG